jgi:hypothetical protein
MTAPTNARRDRLQGELVEAELKLDALSRSKEPGLMRTQQVIAGQRARVLTLRAELAQIEIDGIKGRDELSLAHRAELRADRCDLMLRVKEAELSARAASKQATEDELPLLRARLDADDEMAEEVDDLH